MGRRPGRDRRFRHNLRAERNAACECDGGGVRRVVGFPVALITRPRPRTSPVSPLRTAPVVLALLLWACGSHAAAAPPPGLAAPDALPAGPLPTDVGRPAAPAAPARTAAQPPRRGFSLRTYTDETGSYKYSLFVPRRVPPSGEYPIVLFLHGAAERGTDGRLPATVGLGPIVEQDPDFPAIVVFPQVQNPDGRILTAWQPDQPDGARALKILEEVERLLPVDENHRVLAGWSMGGYGVLAQLAMEEEKHYWSAAVSVAGALYRDIDPAKLAEATRTTPLWMVAGALDRFVPFRETKRTVADIRDNGGRVRFTKVRNAGHGVWETAFAADRFAEILKNPRVVEARTANRGADGRDRPGEVDAAVTDLPDEDEFDREPVVPSDPENFRPDVILERGAFVRADNALLSKLAGQVAGSVSPESLRGSLPDRTETQQVAGHTVTIRFSGITYSGRLENATIRGRDGNVLTVRAELSDARVNIRTIRLKAPLGHRGVAGPVTIRAGVRRPLALEIDVRPYAEDGEIKFRPLGTRFSLPADDYFVCGPRCVDEDGLFLTEAGLARQIVEGIYEFRPQAEQTIRDSAPQLLDRLPGKLAVGSPGGLAGQIFPLPMIEPVVQVRAESVRADAGGLTISFELAVGSTIDQGPRATDPKRADGGITLDLAEEAAGPEELAVGVSNSLVRVLSDELVKDGVPRIDARDVPGDPLRELYDEGVLERILPALAREEYEDHELRARLTLAGPLSAVAQRSDVSAILDLRSDDVELTVDHRPPDAEQWLPAGVVQLRLGQVVEAVVVADGALRDLRAEAIGPARIEALNARSFVGGDVDADLAAEKVRVGWENWLAGEGPFSGPLKDFPVPGTALRVKEFNTLDPSAGVTGGLLIARFAVPDTTLENRSELPLTYRLQAVPGGPWSVPLTVDPGCTHTYRVRKPLRFRQTTPDGEPVDECPLHVGGTYRFRAPDGARVPVRDRSPEMEDDAPPAGFAAPEIAVQEVPPHPTLGPPHAAGPRPRPVRH